jgi:DNA-binding transcriptional ArsR family regulator
MKDGPHIAKIAALLGDTGRADALCALLADRALTASELAGIAGVTKQTMSAHLAKLLDASLIAVDQQGRHRYFRLANEHVAGLLEALMGVAFRTGAVRLLSSPRDPAMRKARVCYDHLAGELGVLAYESMVRHQLLELSAHDLRLSAAGVAWCREAGIDNDTLYGSAASNAAPAWTGASDAITWPDRSVPRCYRESANRVGRDEKGHRASSTLHQGAKDGFENC